MRFGARGADRRYWIGFPTPTEKVEVQDPIALDGVLPGVIATFTVPAFNMTCGAGPQVVLPLVTMQVAAVGAALFHTVNV